MKKNQEPRFSTCHTCGHMWPTGQDGSHSCAEALLKKIKSLEWELMRERCVIELLLVGRFVKREKVEEARQILVDMA